MANEAVLARVRRFNRTVTQRTGALGDRFLARDRPLGASRLLWEIGTEGAEVRALRSRLALDSGQLSRVLRGLEAEGLVEVAPSGSDRRIRVARLTAAGAAERALLDRRSDELAESIITPLSAAERRELINAMDTVVRLITVGAVELRAADPDGSDARRCLRAYFAELDRRSSTGFDLSVTMADGGELSPPHGAFLVAYMSGEPVGCGGVKNHPGEWSEIKRLWVAESARGLGLGRRLLEALEKMAVEAGSKVARLDTNRALVEAITMYGSSGYREIEPFNDDPFAHHYFEKLIAGPG